MLQLIRAGNPGPLTGPGTNSFVLGGDEVAIIDPGPDDPRHRAALLAATRGAPVRAILVTHAHLDHSGGALSLAAETGAPVLGFGPPDAGRSPVMARLAAAGLAGGGEGVDADFTPDRCLRDGERIEGAGWQLTALWTPGHSAGHLAFQWGGTLFTGDLILAWASSLISPPDGDLVDYMRSLERVRAMRPARLLPGHGAEITDPAARIAELVAHRQARTAEILAALAAGPATPATLAARIYDLPPAMLPAAARNVLAHLIALETLGVVGRGSGASPDFFLCTTTSMAP